MGRASKKDEAMRLLVEEKLRNWDDDDDEANSDALNAMLDEQQVKKEMRQDKTLQESAKGRCV